MSNQIKHFTRQFVDDFIIPQIELWFKIVYKQPEYFTDPIESQYYKQMHDKVEEIYEYLKTVKPSSTKDNIYANIKIVQKDWEFLEGVFGDNYKKINEKKAKIKAIGKPFLKTEEEDIILKKMNREKTENPKLLDSFKKTLFEPYENIKTTGINDLNNIPKKIKNRLENDKYFIETKLDGKDEHFFIGKKDGTTEKVHLIFDRSTGETRIDRKDQQPQELFEEIETTLKLKDGLTVKKMKNSLKFESGDEQDKIVVYDTSVEDYFLLELYNSSNEDFENFEIKVYWTQPDGPKERILNRVFNHGDSPRIGYPHKLNILKKGEHIYLTDVPLKTVDKKIKIIINCRSIQTKKPFNLEHEFETPMRG